MAENNYSLRIPVDYVDLGAFTAVSLGAAPAYYALIADEPAVVAKPQSRRTLYKAIAAALVFHLAILALFLVRPAPSRELGTEEGLPENVNVSVISEADLKSLNSDPFRQDSLTSPPASQETPPAPEEAHEPVPPTPPSPVTPPTPPAPATESASAAPPVAAPKPQDPTGYIAKAADEFAASLQEAFEAAAARRKTAQTSSQSPNLRLLRPGASHTGKSTEFERAVVWALAATKPQGNGKWGNVIVTFVISATGQVQGLRLLHSSGDSWLDTGALMAVKQARLPAPSADLTIGDRTFNVEYISRY